MGIFFSEQKVKEDGPYSQREESIVTNFKSGMDPRDGALIIDSSCVDGTSLVKEVPDNVNMPVGQLYLVHPMGLIDYNDLLNRMTAGTPRGEDVK